MGSNPSGLAFFRKERKMILPPEILETIHNYKNTKNKSLVLVLRWKSISREGETFIWVEKNYRAFFPFVAKQGKIYAPLLREIITEISIYRNEIQSICICGSEGSDEYSNYIINFCQVENYVFEQHHDNKHIFRIYLK